jgi:hypothetical protein
MVRQTRKRGSGYLMPAEYYNPSALQPSSNAPALTTAPAPGFVRQILPATQVMSPNTMTKQAGGKRKSYRGGFAPALMGAFAANAQAVAVPLALLGLYSAFGSKSGASNSKNSVKRNNKNSKKNNA